MDKEQQKIEKTVIKLKNVSDSFCLAKWYQLTLYLQNGFNHSCHHPSPHKIPIEEIKKNYKALHNTRFKKEQMQLMLDGKRPSECDYCWKAEDNGNISDRVYKSASSWALPHLDTVVENKTNDIEPTYLEISFSNVCNFKCAYCSPDLSSQWYGEIEKHGAYPTSQRYNGFDWFKQVGKMPIKHSEQNPYVDAFWEWWPELYDKVETLRLTGGEPLLSKDVWRMLDEIEANPKPNLVLAINTNLCVDRELIDRLIVKVNNIKKHIREVQLFTSGEATFAQAEYMRFGLNYKEWQGNLEHLLQNTNCIVAVMTTVNLTSINSYCDFVRYLLDLRGYHNKFASFNKVQFMTNFLRYPEFLALPILDTDSKKQFAIEVEKLIEERGKWDGFATLTYSEVDQLRRMVNYMRSDDERVNLLRADFKLFVDEYDRRRGTDFKTVFPELIEFYKLCQP